MKSAVLFLFLAVSLSAETRLMRYPDVSKDLVVFSYAGDLWTSPRAGGQARRLTSHPGDELYPKFSPDGKWIAFTGEYDGNSDVYVIPSAGGEPRRLTYHPSADMVLGWTPDGRKILFRSNRVSAPAATTKLFTVSPEGGLEEMLPVPRASLTSFSPDGQKIAYNTTSQEFRTWKRYRGGWTNYISIYDLKNNKYDELPRTSAMQMFPMWSGNSIYYISDPDGTMNLYTYDMSSKKSRKLTTYKEFDVKWPSLNNGMIAYENGGKLFYYDIERGQNKAIPVDVNSDMVTARPEIKNVASGIRSFHISPTGVRAVFEARGEIFTVPVENGATRNLTDSPGVHEINPRWSPDGKSIAYLSDKTGEYELYMRPQRGGDEVRITQGSDCYLFGPLWSPDSKKLVYWDKKLRLFYVDVAEKKPVLITTMEYRGGINPDWSPDSRWIAYQKPRNGNANDLYLYSLDQKKEFPISNGFYDDYNPSFDPTGKYLFFLSDRFFYPAGTNYDVRFGYYNTTGIFAITLKADEASPFAPQSDDEKEKAAAEEKKDEKKPGDAKTDEVKPIQIDTAGISNRIAAVPVPAGIYTGLRARKDKIYYMAMPFESHQATGQPNAQPVPGVLHVYDLKKRKDEALLPGIHAYNLDKDGNKLIYRAAQVYGITEAVVGKAKVGEGKLKTETLQARVDPRQEWKEIFKEAWRIERDFYWDPAMGGLDWDKIGKRYESLLPWVAHRSDLNYIIGEMIAELATSHTYVGGGELPDRKRIGVGLLGADFALDNGYYKIAKIYAGENWTEQSRAPLAEPGLKVKEGNYLIAVDGAMVRPPNNPYSYFQDLANKVVTLKINDKPSAEGAWEISVTTTASETGIRYLDWVESRRKIVEKATNGRVAYMHVPDTAISGLIMFDKYLSAQAGKDALIVDERYNGGGFIPDFFTEKLQRTLLNVISPRDGKDQPWPPVAIYGPKVMIVNELAGSGGDAFPWFFKEQKIGPVIGTRTWGGLIGISRSIPLLDGGSVTAPEVAFFSPSKGGEWIVENHGVDPDIVVEQRPDLEVAGHDPQLEKAIELVKKSLETYKPAPGRPKYPKKVWQEGE